MPDLTEKTVLLNETILAQANKDAYILTTGHEEIWEHLSRQVGTPCFSGKQMTADTKYFITKFLQDAGKKVIAYGDSMNDYYMIKQADTGYLVRKQDGSISRSLKNCDLEGLILV